MELVHTGLVSDYIYWKHREVSILASRIHLEASVACCSDVNIFQMSMYQVSTTQYGVNHDSGSTCMCTAYSAVAVTCMTIEITSKGL